MRQTPELDRPTTKNTLKTSATAVNTRARRTAHLLNEPPMDAPHWRRELGFFGSVVLLCGLTVLIFANRGTALTTTTHANTAPTKAVIATATVTPKASTSSSAKVIAAQTHDYSLPTQNPGVMQPVVDQQGNIWFGEMFANALARLDPHTGVVTSWTPPQGQNNIMAIAVDSQGGIWFAEQAANYIGRFNPATQQFTTYPLEKLNGHSAAPQDLKFDGAGNLWFTEVSGAKIGRLNPQTGTITTWPIPAPDAQTNSLPFCLAVTASGQIWFGDLSGGAVGRLDPTTGTVQLYHLTDKQAEVYAMNVDAHGIVWFTELAGGKLGRIDPTTGHIAEITIPQAAGASNGMYALQVASNGDIWIAAAGANALLRYTPTMQQFVVYQLAIAGSIPFGLSFDAAGNLWFTASTSPNYIGMLPLS